MNNSPQQGGYSPYPPANAPHYGGPTGPPAYSPNFPPQQGGYVPPGFNQQPHHQPHQPPHQQPQAPSQPVSIMFYINY